MRRYRHFAHGSLHGSGWFIRSTGGGFKKFNSIIPTTVMVTIVMASRTVHPRNRCSHLSLSAWVEFGVVRISRSHSNAAISGVTVGAKTFVPRTGTFTGSSVRVWFACKQKKNYYPVNKTLIWNKWLQQWWLSPLAKALHHNNGQSVRRSAYETKRKGCYLNDLWNHYGDMAWSEHW